MYLQHSEKHRGKDQLGRDDVEHVSTDLITLLSALGRKPAPRAARPYPEPRFEKAVLRHSWGSEAGSRARRVGPGFSPAERWMAGVRPASSERDQRGMMWAINPSLVLPPY